MPKIESLTGLEVLDSRGRPTVKAFCRLDTGECGEASVPSGASTGRHEAIEQRDGDPERHGGLGCRRAASHLDAVILPGVRGRSFEHQQSFDDCLIDLDGTPDKSRLGANAILGASLAFAKAFARHEGVPLYEHFAGMISRPAPARLPRPTINLFSGGKHAGGQVAIQDVMIVPVADQRMDDLLETAGRVYRAAARLLSNTYGVRPLTADEGGLAPPCADSETMIAEAVQAIHEAGLQPGADVSLAVDVAASHFFHDGAYTLDRQTLDGIGMIEQVARWTSTYPILSVEDALAEEEWALWSQLCKRLGTSVLVVGDDLLCTHPERIRRAVRENAANALLLKVNQIGTLSEAAAAFELASTAGWTVVVSARSGETEDDWLADLAVGWGADQIKIGSLRAGERIAKYNRLLEIEARTGFPVAPWPSAASGLFRVRGS